jgi:hypothetical protein
MDIYVILWFVCGILGYYFNKTIFTKNNIRIPHLMILTVLLGPLELLDALLVYLFCFKKKKDL